MNMEHQYNIMKYTEWEELREELFTPEEIDSQNIRTDYLCKIIETRKESSNERKTIKTHRRRTDRILC